jgi:16S rRNA (guanine966-N2)-methyltransferase
MRIIAGTLKGMTLPESSAEATHPMSEKLRGAIFNALGDITGLTMLDGCAGTGMVGFEAISRGIARVDGVEKDDRAFTELVRNAKLVAKRSSTPYNAIHAGIRLYLKKQNVPAYDVIVYDPPYDIVQTDHFDGTAAHLAPAGIMVLSLPAHIEPPRLPGLQPIKQKTHGIAQLIYYRHG